MTLAWPSALLLLVPLLLVAGWLEKRGAARRGGRLALRLVLLSVLGLALAGPSLAWTRPAARRFVAAVDRSASLGDTGRSEAAERLSAFLVRAKAEGAAATALGFTTIAAQARDAADPILADSHWVRETVGVEPGFEPPPAATSRAAAGLLAARASFGADEVGTVLLLLGPGADLTGLEDLARDLAAAGLTLEADVLPHAPPAEAARVRALEVPAETAGAFEVRASAAGPVGLDARLWVDGRPAGALPVPDDGAREVVFQGLDLPPGRHLVALEVRAHGSPTEDASVPPADLALREVEVRETPRVVLCVADPERSLLRRAAQAQGLLVEALRGNDLGARLAPGTPAFHVLVLDGPTAASLDAPTATLVEQRVAAGMGLFLEAGGDAQAWASLSGSALGALLPVEPLGEPPPPPPKPRDPPTPPAPPPTPPEPRPGPGRKAERQPEEAFPISLLLVLDRSGSMHGARWAMATEAALRAAGVLSSFDRVGVVTFAEEARVDLPMGPAATPAQVALRLPPQADGRGTNIVAALRKATDVMAGEKTSPIRHVLLLTDGYHNPTGMRTEAAIWADIVRPLSALGVTLTVVGLSQEHDERTLKEIVQWAHRGLYIPAYEPSQVPTVFVVDAQRVTEARSQKARARLPDPERAPAPDRTDPPREPTPPAPPLPEAHPPAPSPEALGPDLAPLALGAPHAATRGFEPGTLPSVEAPRRSGPRVGAPVLLQRGEQPFLAARRHGLGRVLAYMARPGDAGLLAWTPLNRLYGQSLRSLMAPLSSFEGVAGLEIVPGPQGDALAWAGDASGATAGWRLAWRGTEAERDLGPASAAAEGTPLELPSLPRGALGHVELRDAAGGVLKAVTYVAGTASALPSAAETAARLTALRLPGPGRPRRRGRTRCR